LARKRDEAEQKVKKFAQELNKKRQAAALKLSTGINSEIKQLNMKGTEFSIRITILESPTATGQDEVTFMIKSSSKDEARPISKIASGGELSRLMLAIKQVVAPKDLHQTYLFDEVDAGLVVQPQKKWVESLKRLAVIIRLFVSLTFLKLQHSPTPIF